MGMFKKISQTERTHLQFCKRLLGVTKSKQNNYGELGRLEYYQNQRYSIVIKYWMKIMKAEQHNSIKSIYYILIQDIKENNRKINWAQ